APLYRVGYDLVPRLRNRLQRVAVDLPVEREHRRVKGLPRVVILSNGLLSGLGRAQWAFCGIRGGTASGLSPFRLPRRLGTATGTDRRWLKRPHRSSRSARWHNRRSPSRSQAQAPTIATRSSMANGFYPGRQLAAIAGRLHRSASGVFTTNQSETKTPQQRPPTLQETRHEPAVSNPCVDQRGLASTTRGSDTGRSRCQAPRRIAAERSDGGG